MKLTTFLTSSLLLSLSHLISATATATATGTEKEIVVDQSTSDITTEKVYVNAAGDVVIPEVFHWGRPALKEKDAAKPRVCGGKLDASGRLGKRQASCPTGYAIACDAYSANPCCPNSSPVCCTNANVCCGTGQFCQGASTCCNAGQIGCGEACCNYGETCCGSNCCGAGFTCSSGSCVAPSGSTTVVPTTLSASSVSEVSRVATGTSIIIAAVATTSSSTTSATCSSGGGDGNGNSNSNSNYQYNGPSASTVGGAVGGSLSALSTALAALSAWFYRKKNQAEAALAAVIAPKPAPVVEEKPSEEAPTKEESIAKEEPAAYETPNENTWVERPITGSPGMAGHGSAYM